MGDAHISVVAGIIVGLLASCVQSLGLTIQRKSHVLNQALPDTQQRVEHRRPLWLLGFSIFISSNVLGSLFQIASLPVVILAPLGAVSLLWNAFFARLLLGDVFSPWMIIGTLLIAGGAVLIAYFGIVPEPTHSLEDLLVLFRRPAFVAYFSLLAAAVVVCLAVTHICEFSYKRRTISLPPSPPLSPLLLSTNSSTDLTTERTPLLDRKPRALHSSPSSSITSSPRGLGFPPSRPSRTPLFLALSYASTSGTLSGMCLLFAKSGVELLLLTLGGSNQFWRWQAWVLLLGLVAFALLQLWYLHKALILADPTIVCPLAFCFYNLSSIVNGLVYFDQIALLPTSHLLLVVTGIAVLLAGVWVVSFHAGPGVDVGAWTEEQEGAAAAGDEELREATPDRRASGLAADADVEAISALITEEPLEMPLSPRSAGRREREREATLVTAGSTRGRRRRPTIGTGHAQGATEHGALSPPSTGTAGFSIGLSPVSPGFALVPRERRRRVSGSVGGGEGGGEHAGRGWTDVVRRMRVRRAVSDGGVEAAAGAGDRAEAGLEGGSAGHADAKGRWRWLRGWVVRGSER